MSNVSLSDFGDHIESLLKELMTEQGGWGGITSLCPPKEVKDDTSKWLVRDSRKRPYAVAICSSPVSPQLIARNVEKADQARQVLGQKYGQVILEPLHVGEYNGLSFAVWPYCFPLSNNRWHRIIQRQRWRTHFLDWLEGAMRATLCEGDTKLVQQRFRIPLEHIAVNEHLSQSIRQAANLAIDRLNSGAWKPHFVLAHNDLWEDNFLLCPNTPQNSFGFVVIDWAGANIKGQAVYDLMRLAESLRIRKVKLLVELQAHCRTLDCELCDLRGYLLASMGYLGMRLEQFPLDRYKELVARCFSNLNQLVSPEYE